MLIESIKKVARRSKLLRKAYKATVNSFVNTHVYEITPLRPRAFDLQGRRLNLLIPTINREHLFGGISTAIRFMEELAKAYPGIKTRIIMTDSSPEPEDLVPFSEYRFVLPEDDSNEEKQILAYNDRSARTFPVGKEDFFIATAWWSAYIIQGIMNWQAQSFNQEVKKLIYFIQDFEPGFYPWSSQYTLAESTYRYNGPQIAVFNSTLLKDYFENLGYHFAEKYCFEPKLNSTLKKYLNLSHTQKRKQILIYGRPSVARNAFTLIIEALRIWVSQDEDSQSWEIVSAGEQHPVIDINGTHKVRSLGKLTLEQYANVLHETAIGISLMVSPHPSYPPLEMAHFGAKVITNSYANKNLSLWHDNIYSLDNCSPQMIADTLLHLCKEWDGGKPGESKVDFYLSDGEQFAFCHQLLRGLQ